jgi:hypothetical protein
MLHVLAGEGQNLRGDPAGDVEGAEHPRVGVGQPEPAAEHPREVPDGGGTSSAVALNASRSISRKTLFCGVTTSAEGLRLSARLISPGPSTARITSVTSGRVVRTLALTKRMT